MRTDAASARWSSTARRARTPRAARVDRAERRSASTAVRRSASGGDVAPGQLDPGGGGEGQVDDGRGARGGGLEGGVGDGVGHRGVDLVADAGEHGHVERGDGAGDELVVERRQVGAGPATAHEGDEVDPGPGGGEQGGGHRPLAAGALHAGVDQHDLPRQRAVGEGLEEVGLGGAADGGDQADAPGDGGQQQGPVAAEQPLGLEQPQHPVALGGEQTEGVAGVDALHLELEATAGDPHVERSHDPDAHAVVHADGAGPLQLGVDPDPDRRPQHHRDAGGHGAGVVAVDEVEPDVAVAAALDAGDLAVDPHRLGEARRDGLAHALDELGDAVGPVRHARHGSGHRWS